MSVITWKIGGPAGFGIMSAGPMFALALKRSGCSVHGYPEYPSIIRGGYNNYHITFSNEPVFSAYNRCDIMVALDKVVFDSEKITRDMIVIADFDNIKGAEGLECKKVNIPFKKIIKDNDFPDIVKNSIALGVSAKILGIDEEVLYKIFKENYPAKVLDMNISAAKFGMVFCPDEMKVNISKSNSNFKDYLLLTGNEAIALGAVKAGIGFYSTYPMTPASSILHYLAKLGEKYGIIVKHTEDEISGITMAIGAAYSGVRAMTGTSGGGLSLMTEGVGLAAITETPLVIVLSQRPGPATGMPTWTEQADLKFVLNISQDEFVRIVLTPGDLNELFYLTFEAFNLAEKYQVPVFVLSDKFLSESQFCEIEFSDEGLKIDRGLIFEGDNEASMEFFPRYKEVRNGIPMKSNPGTPGGLHKAPGTEHDDFGFVATDSTTRTKNQQRRFKKEEYIKKELPLPKLYGAKEAEITFVCWGSTKQPLMEALKYTDKFNFLHFSAVNPIDWEKVKDMLKDKNLVAIETNYTGQLASVIAEKTGIVIKDKYLKYDGRPFFVEEIVEFVSRGD